MTAVSDTKWKKLTKAVVVGWMGLVYRHNGTEDFGSLQGVIGISLLRGNSDDVVQSSWNNQNTTVRALTDI